MFVVMVGASDANCPLHRGAVLLSWTPLLTKALLSYVPSSAIICAVLFDLPLFLFEETWLICLYFSSGHFISGRMQAHTHIYTLRVFNRLNEFTAVD